jgi:hypothetical protein
MDVHRLFVLAGQDLGMTVLMLAGVQTNTKNTTSDGHMPDETRTHGLIMQTLQWKQTHGIRA